MRLLGVLYSLADQDTDVDIAVGRIEERLNSELHIGRVKVGDELKLLKRDGYVDFFESLAGIGSAVVTAAGANASEEFEFARSSKPDRRARLRDIYLRWLWEQIEELDGSPTPDDFLKTNPTFYGVPYTALDLEKTGEWLSEAGFIDGQNAWQYSGPLRPTLTQKGVYTVENQRSVGDPPPSGGTTYNTTVHGSANVAQGNRDVKQELIHNEPWVAQGAQLADLIEQSLPALGTEIQRSLANELASLRAELEGNKEPGRVRRIVGTISNFLGDTGAGALGSVLGAQALQLLAVLPT